MLVAQVARIDVPPRGVDRVAGCDHCRFTAVTDAAAQRARRERAVERRDEEFRFLRHRHAVRLAGALVVVVRGGHRRVVRELAVIEPDGTPRVAGSRPRLRTRPCRLTRCREE